MKKRLLGFFAFASLTTFAASEAFTPFTFREIQLKLSLGDFAPTQGLERGLYRGICIGGMRDIISNTMDVGRGNGPVLDFDFVIDMMMNRSNEIRFFSLSDLRTLGEGYRRNSGSHIDTQVSQTGNVNISERISSESDTDLTMLENALSRAHVTLGILADNERDGSSLYTFIEQNYLISARNNVWFPVASIKSVYHERDHVFFRLEAHALHTLSHYNCYARKMVVH